MMVERSTTLTAKKVRFFVWLDAHPDYQCGYDDITRQRERLAGQLQAIQE